MKNVICNETDHDSKRYSNICEKFSFLKRKSSITKPVWMKQYVANALFHVYVGVGDYTLPLDYFLLVRSDICHLGYHGDTWDYVWCTWDQQTSRVPVGLSDWPPKWWRFSVSVGPGGRMVRSGSWAIGLEARSTVYDCNVNRRWIGILLIRS